MSIITEKPKISVIMLTYNREDLLPRAVKCILNQTFFDYEFIIIDNGSTDQSGKIADDFAKMDSRIQTIHRNRGNIGTARNMGLDLAKGKYIAFIDDDDYTDSDFLSFLYHLAEDNAADIAVCGSNKEENIEVVPNGDYCYDEKYVMSAEEATEYFLLRKLYNAAMPTKLIRRELFENIRFPENGNYDDITTTYRCFACSKKVVAFGKAKYVFYRHPGNNSSAATKHNLLNPDQLHEYLAAFRERTKFIGKVIPSLAKMAEWSEWSYMISMVEKITRFERTNCEDVKNEMLAVLKKHREDFLSCPWTQNFEREWINRFVPNLNSSDEVDRHFNSLAELESKCTDDLTFDRLKEKITEGGVILYGAGEVADKAYRLCLDEGISTKFISDKKATGIHKGTGLPIISRDELIKNHKNSCVLITTWKYEKEIHEELISLGFPKDKIFPMRFRSRIREEKFKQNYFGGYKWIYGILEDNISKQLVLDRMDSYIFSKILIPTGDSDLYYEEGIIELSDNEVFVDAGVYDGSTTLNFIKKVNGHYKKIYSFEPDPDEFLKAKTALKGCKDTEVINCALWNENADIPLYRKCYGESSTVFREDCFEKQNVKAVLLDSFFNDKKDFPTFIKFDIEGAENETLIGAAEIIKAVKPKLAVSAYHKPEDLYKLAKTILSIRNDYKFYIRQYEYGYFDTVLYAV